MRIAISYFYQIRFFKPYMIPISTALSDPKWYHKGTYNLKLRFVDKNGVMNGLRIGWLNPHDESQSKSENHKYCTYCTDDDKRSNFNHQCDFLKDYHDKLNKLDFDQLISLLSGISNSVKSNLKFNQDPLIVLIVHESPDNPCSERWVLQDYFRDHGYELHELIYPIQNNY